jgi:uncharacterized protein (DUF58 family)
MKKTSKIAIGLCLIVAGWLLLPELLSILAILTIIAAKLLVAAIILSFAAFLVWLIGPLTLVDIPRYLYRRYLAAYIRLRRMQRSRNLRQWREAAARGSDQ